MAVDAHGTRMGTSIDLRQKFVAILEEAVGDAAHFKVPQEEARMKMVVDQLIDAVSHEVLLDPR